MNADEATVGIPSQTCPGRVGRSYLHGRGFAPREGQADPAFDGVADGADVEHCAGSFVLVDVVAGVVGVTSRMLVVRSPRVYCVSEFVGEEQLRGVRQAVDMGDEMNVDGASRVPARIDRAEPAAAVDPSGLPPAQETLVRSVPIISCRCGGGRFDVGSGESRVAPECIAMPDLDHGSDNWGPSVRVHEIDDQIERRAGAILGDPLPERLMVAVVRPLVLLDPSATRHRRGFAARNERDLGCVVRGVHIVSVVLTGPDWQSP